MEKKYKSEQCFSRISSFNFRKTRLEKFKRLINYAIIDLGNGSAEKYSGKILVTFEAQSSLSIKKANQVITNAIQP